MATSITTTQSTRQYPLSRYDDRNIADPILRAELRKEVMLMCESNENHGSLAAANRGVAEYELSE